MKDTTKPSASPKDAPQKDTEKTERCAREVSRLRAVFESGGTLPVEARLRVLRRLRTRLRERKEELLAALHADLGKSRCEGYMSELAPVLSEISYFLRRLPRLAAKKRVRASLSQFPATCFTLPSPYGVALIMSPWNYPLQLTLCPLVDCIAAGNCALVKPSAYAPATGEAIASLLSSLGEECIGTVLGGREENKELLRQKYDLIFFTGGVPTGRIVAEAAAKTLTPVVLELGGKSPCIVDADADISLAAKRICFGKFLNAGQTCVAPDYILAHAHIKDALVEAIEQTARGMFGDALRNESYPHIVNKKHFDRVRALIDPEKTVFGGEWEEKTLRIAPTLLDGVSFDDPVMKEEIFGPVLPVLTFLNFDEVKEAIARNPAPLALYYFGKKNEARALGEISFGGGCVNDTVLHLVTHHMGFGGIGTSGMGAYHGEQGFYAFSHVKSILKKGRMDNSLRYAPYTDKKCSSFERLFR